MNAGHSHTVQLRLSEQETSYFIALIKKKVFTISNDMIARTIGIIAYVIDDEIMSVG